MKHLIQNTSFLMKSTSVTSYKACNVRAWVIALAVAVMAPHPEARAQQAPVSLLSTSPFAVLAETEITDVPASAITGNVGLSPAARTFISGLTGPQVTGSIYAASDGGATAIMLTRAQGDLTTAYNDAAGRTPVPTGPFLNPGTGNLGGLTLTSGLYKFTSSALLSGSDLTLTGGATNVWIFQIASELNVDDGMQVLLAGGAQASNIFWQVGTSASLGTTTVFQGTIMAHDQIAFATGATLYGRALAQTAVTLESTTITIPNPEAAPPIFGLTSRAGDGTVTLVINTTPNLALTVQTSTNLLVWTTLSTTTPVSSPYSFTDTAAAGAGVRYYRAFYP
jgi:hypothetical protein